LTGDGGDDIFLGYPFFAHAWMAEKLARRLPDFAAPMWRALRGIVPGVGPVRRARSFLDYATGGLGPYAQAHDGFPYFQSRGILGERLAGLQPPERRLPASIESARHLLEEVFQSHRRLHFTSEFMPKVDGGAMYYALEARAPFLDQKLWEFGATLPPEIRLHGGTLKAVLREIARRRVSTEVAVRRKQGFTVPVERWLANHWSGLLDRLRGDTILERDGWVRRGALRVPLQAALNRGLVPVQLWRLLVLEGWLEKNSQHAAHAA
jgi:asparagine synthase (glutamine-hydrolysing)